MRERDSSRVPSLLCSRSTPLHCIPVVPSGGRLARPTLCLLSSAPSPRGFSLLCSARRLLSASVAQSASDSLLKCVRRIGSDRSEARLISDTLYILYDLSVQFSALHCIAVPHFLVSRSVNERRARRGPIPSILPSRLIAATSRAPTAAALMPPHVMMSRPIPSHSIHIQSRPVTSVPSRSKTARNVPVSRVSCDWHSRGEHSGRCSARAVQFDCLRFWSALLSSSLFSFHSQSHT